MFKSCMGSNKFLPKPRLNADQMEPVYKKNHRFRWRDIWIFTIKFLKKEVNNATYYTLVITTHRTRIPRRKSLSS